MFHEKAVMLNSEKLKDLNLTVIIPAGRKEIPFGTFKSILRQANLTAEEFKKK